MAEQRRLLRAATLALAGCAVALLGWRRCAAVEAAPPSAAPEATAGAAAQPLDTRAPGPARAAAAAVGPQITGVVLGALERPLPAARVSLVTRSSEAEVEAGSGEAGSGEVEAGSADAEVGGGEADAEACSRAAGMEQGAHDHGMQSDRVTFETFKGTQVPEELRRKLNAAFGALMVDAGLLSEHM